MFAYYHAMAPKLKLLELAICRSFYEARDPTAIVAVPTWPGFHIDEDRCKQSSIQQHLSNLRSWGVFFDGLCTLLLSIPYGALADRHGRKLVYMCSLLGLVLSNAWFVLVCSHFELFPVAAVLFSSAFLTIGGGSWVVVAISSTMATDVADEQTRSTVLYWLLSVYYLGYVAGTGLAPMTMQTAWLPFFLALLSASVAAIIAALMPHTQPPSQTAHDPGHDRPGRAMPHEHQTFWRKLSTLVHTCSQHISRLKSHPQLVLIFLVIPLISTRGTLSELVLPYVSKRYSWPLSRAGAMDAINGAVSLLLGIFVLPCIMRTLTGPPYHLAAVRADAYVARYSVGALCVGAVVVGLAPNVGIMIPGWIIFSTGACARMSALAVATALVVVATTSTSTTTTAPGRGRGRARGPSAVARLNAGLVAAEALVDMAVSPLVWRAWSVALSTAGERSSSGGGGGPRWLVVLLMGLPWFVVAAAMAVAEALLLVLVLPLPLSPPFGGVAAGGDGGDGGDGGEGEGDGVAAAEAEPLLGREGQGGK
ncbi:mfs transporter [Diplodia corticola]|uniref:Mfs transporter n=1 Tax=Diplodia corticola TaxID=236234 RepID=A0A1J9RAM9_9PEZI|nr:mfs transporter [Diplodia corticola]OJD37218.1 mfs transporter [Diplodia corticola]